MSAITIIEIVYGVIGFVVGYQAAREVYTAPYSGPSEMPNHHLPSALLVWVVMGAMWPLVLLVMATMAVGEFFGRHEGRSLGDIIFRVPR